MQVLFARHHVRVFRFVLRLVRDEAKAEDLISEVFLDVWRQASRFEGRAAVSTWLLAIARFKALSILRRKREDELDDEGATAVEDPQDNPSLAFKRIHARYWRSVTAFGTTECVRKSGGQVSKDLS